MYIQVRPAQYNLCCKHSSAQIFLGPTISHFIYILSPPISKHTFPMFMKVDGGISVLYLVDFSCTVAFVALDNSIKALETISK